LYDLNIQYFNIESLPDITRLFGIFNGRREGLTKIRELVGS